MTRTFTENDTVIRVGSKERFALELSAIPTAGYKWEVAFDSSLLTLLDESYKPTGKIGGKNVQRFEFEPRSTGKVVISATYKRPWEAQAQEKKSFDVTIGK